ncbi:MAG: cation transporter [Eubacterium sp.]|nr:cation transporter [Eubacterium sp.]
MDERNERNRIIIRTSIIGILANVFLAGFKAVIGLMSASVAILMDAVNNLSDAASSVITIVGTKLAGKEADKKHPFGYGRIEYLSAMVISILVLYAGITAFVESVKKIVTPDVPDYSTIGLIIVAVAVVVKIVLGLYVKSTGNKVNSDSLKASGADALMDSVISASTLVAAGIYLLFDVSTEAWLGAIISLVIIKSGIDMLRETLSKILGESVDPGLARDIRNTVNSFSEISGVYDLVLHDYGPDFYNGSVHIEVPDTLSADDVDKLLRKVQIQVYEKHNVVLTAVGVYAYNTKDPEVIKTRDHVSKLVKENPHILQMHGFNMDQKEMTMRFDIVVSLDARDRLAVYSEVCEKVEAAYPEYTLQVAMDTDYSEQYESFSVITP